MAFSTDGRQKERDASSAGPGQGEANRSGAETEQNNVVERLASINAPAQPSAATATAMAELRSRLAASHAAHERPRNPPGAAASSGQSSASTSAPQSSLQPRPAPARRQEATEFQGVPLQLGELGNPLQSMAVLTHTDVRQLEEYGKDPLASDQRFLSSLHKMAPAPQQRAAAIMQMAAGAVPPPAVLVWAAQEVVEQLRRVLRERLQVQQGMGVEGVQGSAAGAVALVSEPWYEGALQLARLEQSGRGAQPAGSHSQPQPHPQPQHPMQPGAGRQPPAVGAGGGAPGTELELLRAFAAVGHRREEAGVPPSEAGTPPQPYPKPRVVGWEALLALPQLQPLLEVAESRSPELAAVLRLSGLRPGPSPAGDTAPGGQAATAEAAEATAVAASGSGKGKQRPKAPAAEAAASPAAAPAPGTSWLLPALRSSAAAARGRALRVAGLAGSRAGDGGPPLDAEAALTALALGARNRPGVGAGADGGDTRSEAASAPSAEERRAVAADWLAAATLLRHAEERLGCAGGASGVRQEAVAALHLLGLPLEPQELPYMDELKVSEQEVLSWQSQLSTLLAAAPGGPDSSVPPPLPPPPAALLSRLSAARERLATSGRALALVAPEPAAGEPAWSPEAAATRAWLRAVGAPLVSGLLSGGYGSLSRLRAMVPELREALVLRLLEAGRVQGGTAALAAALYGDTEAAYRAARSDGTGAATASALLQREAVEAELDLLHDRYVATPPAPPPPLPLPSDAALAAAVQALPPPARTLYDSYYVLRGSDGDADPAVLLERRRVAEALLGAEEGAVLAGLGDLKSWLSEARKGLLLLPAPLLALLLRFLRVQVSVTPDEARAQRTKLTALALLVAEQQRRAVAAVEGRGAGRGGETTATAAATVARDLAKWSQSGGGGATGGPVPAALAALLGSSAAMDFSSWLQAVALSSASVSRSTYALLAGQQLQRDVERYLAMTHDPRLHLPTSGLRREGSASGSSSPSSVPSCRPTSTRWTDLALRRSEGDFLQDMRPKLDAYLQAMGHRQLGDAEWAVYRDAALEEWDAGRGEREESVAAAGQSGFFNPRADEVYLQQMVETGIPLGDPLGPQSRRYLDTLLRNPSWSFAQRRQAVQRLIQLNAHFARQPLAPEGGSPFAPLFVVGGPDVVPRLGPLGQGEGAAGCRGAAAAAIGEAPELPPGF